MVRGKPWHPSCRAAAIEPVIAVTPAVEPILRRTERPQMEADIGSKRYPTTDELDLMLPLVEDLIKESYPDCSGCKTPIRDVSLRCCRKTTNP